MPGLEPRASCLLGKLSPAESSLLLVLPLVVPAHCSWKFELLESHKKNSEDARGSHQPHQPARVERRVAFLGRTQDVQESHWFPSCSSGDRGSWTPAKYSASGLPLALFLTETQQDHLSRTHPTVQASLELVILLPQAGIKAVPPLSAGRLQVTAFFGQS